MSKKDRDRAKPKILTLEEIAKERRPTRK